MKRIYEKLEPWGCWLLYSRAVTSKETSVQVSDDHERLSLPCLTGRPFNPRLSLTISLLSLRHSFLTGSPPPLQVWNAKVCDTIITQQWGLLKFDSFSITASPLLLYILQHTAVFRYNLLQKVSIPNTSSSHGYLIKPKTWSKPDKVCRYCQL